jgi:hypothetical protein
VPPEGGPWSEVEQDRAPVAFGNVVGGMQHLPSYTLYKNPDAFERAFVVSSAAPLDGNRSALAALKATDLSRIVLLEQLSETEPGEGHRDATIIEYRPNRVIVDVGGGSGGYLVLTDVWFPGWTCTVDGQSAEVLRGDYIFRAVRIPDGARTVVFRFEPQSYQNGTNISCISLGVLCGVTLAGLLLRRRLLFVDRFQRH